MTHRMITAPVIIPETPDCDYKQGEPPLTREQIQAFHDSFEDYQIIDYDHQFTDPDSKWYMKQLGTPIKSWISSHEIEYTNVMGNKETIPAGTWWLTTKVTDPQAIQLIDKGLLTAYSISVGNKSYCDKFMRKLATANKSKVLPFEEVLAAKRKTLIKDITNPVGFTVSLTGMPCVGSSMFSLECLTGSQQANKKDIGGQHNMSEETNETKFSVRELLGLRDLFANKSDETPKEDETSEEEEAPKKTEDEKPKEDKYVTTEELDEKIEGLKEELVDIFDEKLEKVVEKLTVKKEEKEDEEDTSKEEDEDEKKDETANKHKTPMRSSQLDNTDDGYNQNTANKNTSTNKARFMAALNRKPNGEYKFPRNY